MKICDKNQIRHESKTWTAVMGSSKDFKEENFDREAKVKGPAAVRRTILVTDFWEHGHETPDIIKEGISFI
jgi:hypothetical protein